MKCLFVFVILMLSLVASPVNAQPASYEIAPDLQVQGDYSDKEILRYRRIRIERQEVLFDETNPLLCKQGNTLLVVGRGGSIARSSDGGLHWNELENLTESGPSKGEVKALGSLESGAILAVVGKSANLSVIASDDLGQTWKSLGRLSVEGDVSESQGSFLELADGTLLFSIGTELFVSRDHGASWKKRTTLADGWSDLRPLVDKGDSEKLLACALYTGTADDKCRNTVILQSTDQGKSWEPITAATRINQVPGNLVELPDGRLVLSYGEESFPYGARALISDDGGATWGEEVYVLGQSRYGLLLQPRPEACEPASGISTVVLDNGVMVSAYDRGKTLKRYQEPGDGRKVDEWGNQPAISVVRWTPEGFDRPPLIYPSLMTDRVDSEGYLDNGLVRIRPDDRFEGGDYIENYETIVYRRLPAEQLDYGDIGGKGLILCRHPDGSLMFTCRFPEIYRSTDEGQTWKKFADIDRPKAERVSTSGFGITNKGTLLTLADVRAEPTVAGGRPTYKMHIGRSTDNGKTWNYRQIDPGPKHFGGRGDGSRINQLSDGTVVINTSTAWVHPSRNFCLGEVIIRSTDDGQTWGDPTVLPPSTCESNMVELPSGRLVLATRLQSINEFKGEHYFGPFSEEDRWEFPSRNYVGEARYKHEAIMFSDDNGYNWTKPFVVTRIHMVSADVVCDHEGRVALTYDHKDAIGGCRARVSKDDGKTWETENYILCYEKIGQRTSSTVLKDGRILTLWAAGYPRNRVRGTIWSPE